MNSLVQSAMDQIKGYVAASCQFRLSIDESYECSQPVYEENLCLFHTPKLSESDKQGLSEAERSSVQGTERKFLEKLIALIAKKEKGSDEVIDLRGFQFTRMKFPSLSKRVDFTGGVFAQSIDFDRAEFQGEATFAFAQFPANASFQSTAFRKGASFEQAVFGGVELARVTFLNAVFDGGVNFSGAGFACEANFSRSKFGKDGVASFWDASFKNDATFTDCLFSGQTLFRAKFHGETFFRRTEFGSEARFAQSTFDAVADFQHCRFSSLDFSWTLFKGDALFEGAEFRGPASFQRCRFEQLTSYPGVTFEQSADFSDSRFLAEFVGYGSKYKNRTTFLLAEFAADTDLRNCVFDEVDFMAASFAGAARFSNSFFGGPVNFNHATFGKEAQFINDRANYSFNDEVDFGDLNIGPEGRLTFRNVNLEKGRFTNTYLGAATFSNVRWFRHRNRLAPWPTRKECLWDEFRSPSPSDGDTYESIAENYRQLVLNYEHKRDYETAESFHIGEMEMRRKKKGTARSSSPVRKFREWFNSYGIYKASSNYGTSYGQALLILILLVFCFSLAFQYSGFQTTTDNPRRTIEYNLFADSSHRAVSMREWLDDYLSAMSLCASVVTFQKDRFYEPLEGPARAWLFAAVITLAGQAAMALLALRRRFRR